MTPNLSLKIKIRKFKFILSFKSNNIRSIENMPYRIESDMNYVRNEVSFNRLSESIDRCLSKNNEWNFLFFVRRRFTLKFHQN